MNKSSSDLILLVRLNCGDLQVDEADSVRRRIRSDETLRRRWNRIRRIASPIEHDLALHESDDHDDAIKINESAESVAAFLEGRLDERSARTFERRCWKSRWLLTEFVDTYRFVTEYSQAQDTVEETDISDTPFGRRLLALEEQLAASADVYSANGHGADPIGGLFSAAPTDVDELARIRELASRQNEKPEKSVVPVSRETHRASFLGVCLAVATAIIVLLAGSLVFVLVTDRPVEVVLPHSGDDSAVDEQNDGFAAANGKADRASNNDQLVTDDATPTEESDEFAPERIPFPPPLETGENAIVENTPPERKESDGAKQPDEAAVDQMLADRPAATNIPDVEQPPGRESSNDTGAVALDLKWSKTHGVVARMVPQQDRWVGINSETSISAVTPVATLPHSWAEAETGDFGSIVLNSNSMAKFAIDANQTDTIVMQLFKGQVAFRDVPTDRRFDIRMGNRQWNVVTGEGESIFAVDWFRGMPRLLVRRGQVKLGSRQIAEGRQIVWQGSQLSAPEAVQGRVGWIHRRPEVKTLSRKICNALMTSENLVEDLERVMAETGNDNQVEAMRYAMALRPGRYSQGLFNSENQIVRLQAFDWMVQTAATDPSMLRAWNAVARRTADTDSTNKVNRWIRDHRPGQIPSADQAREMCAMLGNPRLIFRQAATYFLTRAFGNPHEYHPAADVTRRREAARKWMRTIVEQYPQQPANQRMRDNPQRRAGGGTGNG